MMILSREPAVSHLENVTAKPANLAAKRGSERRERESGSLSKSVALEVQRSEACYQRGKLTSVLLRHLIRQHSPKLRIFNRNTKSGWKEGGRDMERREGQGIEENSAAD